MNTDLNTAQQEPEKVLKLSKQAVTVLMVTLQKCLIEQSDITELLDNWELEDTPEGLVVLNPPTVMGLTEE